MKKLLALLLALVMLFALCACGAETEEEAAPAEEAVEEAPAEEVTDVGDAAVIGEVDTTEMAADAYIGKTLTVATDTEPESLFVQSASPSSTEGYIGRCIYSFLFDRDEEGNYVPSVCTNYEWVDETHLRLTLREGVTFSDGSELTAEDVIFSWTVGLEGTAASTYGSPWIPEEFYAEDDYNVILVTDSAYPYWTDTMDELYYPIVSKSMVEGLGGMTAACLNPVCGSGRYVFDEWVTGQYITIKYNENYWDDTYVPSYEYIKFTFIPDTAARCLAVKSGAADMAVNISLADTYAYTEDDEVVVDAFTAASCGGAALFYKCDEGPFADENVRLALRYLVDWKACAKLLTGSEDSVIEGWFNAGSPYYAGEDTRYYDFEKGMEYLQASAYADGFTFELKIEPTDGYTAVAELIQSYLLEAGITAELVNVEFANWFTMFSTGEYECYLGGCASTPLRFALGYMDARDGSLSLGGPNIVTDEMTAFLDVASSTFDPDERAEAIIGLQEYCMEHGLVQGVCGNNHYLLRSPSVGRIVPDASGYALLYYITPTGV